jgi:hypothetical protein
MNDKIITLERSQIVDEKTNLLVVANREPEYSVSQENHIEILGMLPKKALSK